MKKPVLAFVLTLVLSACGGDVLPDLPSGEQTVEGVLRAAELSAVRRGSHLIEQENTPVYYAESSLISLREYQDKRVTLRGQFEHNTDPEDLPVLVVESVVNVEETVKEHTLSKAAVRLEAPVHWKLVEREGKYQFRLEEDQDEPLLSVWQEAGELLPDGGVPIVVDATRAARLVDELTNAQLVSVKRDGQILNLQFTPGTRLSADRLREDFLILLSSIDLINTTTSTTTPNTGTGALGTPCGGAAGILCPQGQFCDIQDFAENIGRCRKL